MTNERLHQLEGLKVTRFERRGDDTCILQLGDGAGSVVKLKAACGCSAPMGLTHGPLLLIDIKDTPS